MYKNSDRRVGLNLFFLGQINCVQTWALNFSHTDFNFEINFQFLRPGSQYLTLTQADWCITELVVPELFDYIKSFGGAYIKSPFSSAMVGKIENFMVMYQWVME